MWPLVQKEFVQMRLFFSLLLAGVLALGLASIRYQTLFDSYAWAALLFVYVAFALPLVSFSQEEKNNTLLFLRALPLHPRAIVAARYVVLFLVTSGMALAFLGFDVLGAGGNLGGPTAIMLTRVLPPALAFSGILYFLYFWLGPKTAKTVIMGLTLVLNVLGFVAMAMTTSSPAGKRLIVALVDAVKDYSEASLAWSVTGLLVLLGTYLASAHVFAHRDASKTP